MFEKMPVLVHLKPFLLFHSLTTKQTRAKSVKTDSCTTTTEKATISPKQKKENKSYNMPDNPYKQHTKGNRCSARSRVRLGFPHFDVVDLQCGVLAVVVTRVPGGVPLGPSGPESVSLVSDIVLPGLGVRAVGVAVREEAHASHRYVKDQVELQQNTWGQVQVELQQNTWGQVQVELQQKTQGQVQVELQQNTWGQVQVELQQNTQGQVQVELQQNTQGQVQVELKQNTPAQVQVELKQNTPGQVQVELKQKHRDRFR